MASSIILRSYQTELIHKARELMKKGCKSILIASPCGSGKTALTAHMLHTAASKGMRSLFVLHRRELLRQSVDAFNKEGLSHGIISAGFAESPTMRVQIASVQTLGRRLNRQPEPLLIVWDECHHLAAASWTQIFRRFPHAYHIGLSATPARLDGKGLGEFFKELLCGPSVSQLIADGYLSPYKMYAPSTVDVSDLHIRMGDYEKKELSRAVDKPTITGSAVEHYVRLAKGKRAIVFCVSIQHSQHIVEKFKAEGINAEHVDGETASDVRDRAIEDFKAGNIQVLSNVELFGEGFDVPAMEVAILMRPTQSLSLYLQQIGRALRPSPGKTVAVVLDHAGNCLRHGLPDDERKWTLDGHVGRTKGVGAVSQSIRVCPSCFAAQVARAPACRFCHFVFEVKPRKIQEKEGELSEVTRVARQARQEQGRTDTLEGLIELGKQRHYKNPYYWAKMVFNARQARKIGKFA